MSFLSDLVFEARITALSLADYVSGNGLRLGVTGLSRAGKTVFITALVQALTSRGGRLPVFRAAAEGRIARGTLQPQPDDAVPRFAVEDHVKALTLERLWPESTSRISELRLTIEYERQSGWRNGRVDPDARYRRLPGRMASRSAVAGEDPTRNGRRRRWRPVPRRPARRSPPQWRGTLAGLHPTRPPPRRWRGTAHALFTSYLRASRTELYALSTLPPGRFLMPGDLEGSPALTFAPLPVSDAPKPGSLAAMMERRYEAYKAHVVKPFFRDHFARLDRQIVLVDALSALNSGPAAVRDLQNAMTDVLLAFRAGRSNLLSTVFRPRIDKILFAATKADHLHHTSHDRLEAILRLLTARAISKAEDLGATVDVIALAAVRATREASVKHGREMLDAIVGTPLPGETIEGETFDGEAEAAIFPGELPADPKAALRGDGLALAEGEADYRFVRFRPPLPEALGRRRRAVLPHIRLDRALQFLLGDRLA